NTSKSALKDHFPKCSQYNAEHYATLVAYPADFHKYPEPFLCLIGISRNYTLDEDTYPQFLRDNDEGGVSERQRAEGEPKLLDTNVRRVVPLLLVAPAHALSKLEASVNKLFDEGGSGGQTEQGDSASGGHGVGILPVSDTAEILREDYETSTRPSVAGKSRSALQRLLAGAVLNLEVGITALPTLLFITSSVSVTSERESANIAEAEVDSFFRPSILLMIVATSVTSIVDPTTTIKEKFVESFVFSGDSSGGGADHTVRGFSNLTGSDFIVGGIRTVISLDVDLQKVYVPQWCVTNGSRLDDGRTCREMVDEFAPPKFFASICGMDHDQLLTEFNVGLLAKCPSVLK
ncbi:hypothetical protein Tco_0998585, partial [Tanacetum coccineum]